MIKRIAGMYAFPVFFNRSKERNGAVPATNIAQRFQLKENPVKRIEVGNKPARDFTIVAKWKERNVTRMNLIKRPATKFPCKAR